MQAVKKSIPTLQHQPVNEAAETRACQQSPLIDLRARFQNKLANEAACCGNGGCDHLWRCNPANAAAVQHSRKVDGRVPCHVRPSAEKAQRGQNQVSRIPVHVKRHRGAPGHTRDTRAHTGVTGYSTGCVTERCARRPGARARAPLRAGTTVSNYLLEVHLTDCGR